MRKVLMVGGPRHGDMIEAEGAAVKLPIEREYEFTYTFCPIDRLPDGQWIARWPEDVEWRKPKPKFKVGDRVRHNHSVWRVDRVNGTHYQLSQPASAIGWIPEHELEPAPTLEDVILDATSGDKWQRWSSISIAKAIREAFPEAGL